MFVEPDDLNGMNRAKEGIDSKFFKLIPTTVMLGPDGLIRVIFMAAEITYNLSLEEVESAHARMSQTQTIAGPDPPRLHEAFKSSLDIYWELQYPPGIIQTVEIQYAIVYNQSSMSYRKRSERVFKSSRGGVFNGFYGSQWLSWIQKRWSEKNFFTASLEDLNPGTGYLFRMRFRGSLGWSEYSEPSPVYLTRPDVPSKPKPVSCIAKTPNSALLKWVQPECSNGAPILGYVLQGRSVGDDFIQLYDGPKTSYIVFSLFPEFAYSFRIAAVNSEGMSQFSDLFSVQMPSRLHFRGAPIVASSRELVSSNSYTLSQQQTVGEDTPIVIGYEEAMRCRQAWKECWDERSQSFFYFNMMTGVRQRDRPDAWNQAVRLVHVPASYQLGIDVCEERETNDDGSSEIESADIAMEVVSKEISEEEIERQKENELRNKKFFLYKTLNKTSNSGGSSNPFSTNGRQKMVFRRDSLLEDSYKYFVSSSSNQLRAGRLQVEFEGEEGIDSGGLSKEFFLIVSRQAKKYALHNSRKYILDVGGKMFFRNRIQRALNTGDSPVISIKTKDSEIQDRFKLPGELPRANVGVQVTSSMDGNEDEAVLRAEFCYFLGRFMAKAILDRQFIDLALCPILWKHLLSMQVIGHSFPLTDQQKCDLAVTISDLQLLDRVLSQSLTWMRTNSVEGVLDESFVVQLDVNGEMVPLCRDGENMTVDDGNKGEYIDLLIKWRTEFCIKTELNWFVRVSVWCVVIGVINIYPYERPYYSDRILPFQGFCEVVPRKAIIDSGLTIDELSLILNGKQSVDAEEIRAYTIYQSSKNDKPNTVLFGEQSDSVSWLWMMLRKMDPSDQGKFLFFVTGTSCVPLDGYDPPFNITDGEDMPLDSLPRAHTCFNQIVLPQYSSYEIMRQKVMFAIYNTEGFGLS